MKKLFLHFAAILLIAGSQNISHAQGFQKTYGGTQDDRAYSVIQTADGGYCVSGNNGSSASTQYLHVVKFDNTMNVQWTFRINASSPNQTGRSLIQTADGGFVIAGNNNGIGGSVGSRDYYILKLDGSGSLLWTRVLDQNGAGNNSLYSIKELPSNGGFICAGTTDASCGTANIALIKLNSDGTYAWKSNLGACNGSGDSWPARVEIANDGGFVVCGTSNSGSNGGGDLYLLKTTSSGSVSWGKRVGGSSYIDQGFALTKANDGGFAVAGYTKSYPTAHAGVGKNVYVVKFDSGGGLQWTRTIGGTSGSGSGDNIANSIIQTAGDDGFLVAGSTSFYGTGGGIDGYAAKLTSAGTLSWTKTFGGSSTDEVQSVIQNTDGDFVMAGLTASYGNPAAQFDWYLITMASDGSMCGPNTSSGGNSGSGGGTGTDTNNPTTSITDRGTAGTTSSFTGTTTSLFSVSVSPSSASICIGSSTTLTASGASGYTWSPSTGLNTTTGATVIANPTTTTTYTVTGTGSNNCGPQAVTVTVNPLPTPSISGTNTLCSGSSATLTASGGSTYSWSTGATSASITVSPTVTTTYSVTVTSSFGCIANTSYKIFVPIDLGSSDACANNVAMTDSIIWFKFTTDSQNVRIYIPIPGISSGNLKWYGGASCSSLSLIRNESFQQDDENSAMFVESGLTAGNIYLIRLMVNSPPSTISICKDDFSTLACTPPTCNYIYNGSVEAGIVPTNFGQIDRASCWHLETIAGTCGVTAAANNTPDLFDPAVSPSTFAGTCGNNASVGVPVNFETSNTSAFSGSRYIGIYTGEKVSADIQTLTNDMYVLQFYDHPGTLNASCGAASGLCIELMGTTAPYNIGTISPLSTSSSSWTQNSMCVDLTAVANISQYNRIAFRATAGKRSLFDDFSLVKLAYSGPDVTLACNGDCSTIGGSSCGIANVTYSWAPATGLSNPNILNPNACPTVTTTYSLTATYTDPITSNVCIAYDNLIVTVPPAITLAMGSNQTICAGNCVTITGSATGGTPGLSYSWSPATSPSNTTNPQACPAATTNYTLTVTDANGCTKTGTVTVTVNPLPSISISGTTTLCNGQNTTLTASGGMTYSWAPGGQTTTSIVVNPTTATTYTVTGISSFGCVNTATATVTVGSSPTVTISGTNTICSGQSTTLTASGGTSYSWSPGNQTTTSITVSPIINTTYSVTGTSASGCTNTATVLVTVVTPTITITDNRTICTSTTTTLTASGGTSYVWAPGGQTTTNIVVSTSPTTAYTVTATDAFGCTGVAIALVSDDCPDFLYQDCFVWMDYNIFATYPGITDFGIVVYEYNSTNNTCTGTVTNSVTPTSSPAMQTFQPGSNIIPYPWGNHQLLILPTNHDVLNLTTDFGLNSLSWISPFLATGKDYLFQLQGSFNGGTSYSAIGPSDCITTLASSPCTTVVTKLAWQDTGWTKDVSGIKFDLYPNPAKNNVTLYYSLPANQSGVLEVYDVFGKLCLENILLQDRKYVEIYISSLNAGIYYYRIRTEQNITIGKKLTISK